MAFVAENTEIRPLVRAKLPQLASSRLVLLDSYYAFPTQEWIEEKFVGYFENYLKAYGLKFWTKESYDCDDFALGFMTEARKAHRISRNAPAKTSLAVGFMTYTADGTEGIHGRHAANIAIVGSDILECVTLEPQSGKITNLTPKEIASCDLVLL